MFHVLHSQVDPHPCALWAATESTRAIQFEFSRYKTLVGENWAEERALVTQETFCLFVVTQCRAAFRIGGGLCSIVFVGGQRGKSKERQRYVAGALAGKKIAVMLATEFLHQRHPHLAVDFELLELAGIENVAQITSDQVGLLTRLRRES